jgi:hypothetical protein
MYHKRCIISVIDITSLNKHTSIRKLLNYNPQKKKGKIDALSCLQVLQVQLLSVAHRGGFRGLNTPPPPKFQSFAIAQPNFQFRGIYIRKNVLTIWVLFIWKLSRIPDQGATAPRSPFSLPSILNWIFWTPFRKNSWVRHWLLYFDTHCNVDTPCTGMFNEVPSGININIIAL